MASNHIQSTTAPPAGNADNEDDDIVITAEIPPRSPEESSGIDVTYWSPGTTSLTTNATPAPDIEVVAEVPPRPRHSSLNHSPDWSGQDAGDHTANNDSTSRWLSTVIREPLYEPRGAGRSRGRGRFLPPMHVGQSRPPEGQSSTRRYNLRRRPLPEPSRGTRPPGSRRRSLRHSEPLPTRSGPGMLNLDNSTWMDWIHWATDIASNYQLPLGFGTLTQYRNGSSSTSNTGNRLHRQRTTGLSIMQQNEQDSPGPWSDWNTMFITPSNNGTFAGDDEEEGDSDGSFTAVMGGSLPEEPPDGYDMELLSELANVMDPNYIPSRPLRSCDIPGTADYVPPPALKLKVCQKKVEQLPHFTRKVPNADPVELPTLSAVDGPSPVQSTDVITSTTGTTKTSKECHSASQSTRLAIVCPKCHVPIHSMCTTTCGHILCTPCADSMDVSESCPSCRTTIRKAGVRRLFL